LVGGMRIAFFNGRQDTSNFAHRRHRGDKKPRATPWPRSGDGVRNRSPPCASHLVGRQVLALSRRQPLSVPSAWPEILDFFGTTLVIEPSPGQLTSDAGLLPIR
jgi:hypothetical protein